MPASRSIAQRRAAAIRGAVERWFPGAARDLPWRTPPRDPYRSLVSESMLQQTQVSRVVDRFAEFMRRYPTVRDLARSRERDVLALWSGLGYYRRATNLRLAARAIVERHDGAVPASVDELLALPGVGRYTAGAIASIVFGRREPVVDGNVRRVLLRVEGREPMRAGGDNTSWAWSMAEMLVRACRRPGVLNEGLMELGATVCTPASPRCGACPLRRLCATTRARAAGAVSVSRRSAVSPTRTRPTIFCASVIVREPARGRLLVAQRPGTGMWAGLWQAPTVERPDRPPTLAQVRGAVEIRLAHLDPDPVASFRHLTTHRVVHFEVYVGALAPAALRPNGRQRWVLPADLDSLGLSSPQRRILGEIAGSAARRSPVQ